MTINYSEYRKKLKGCFVGKAVGGTLGMPNEGFIGTKTVTYYDPIPDSMVANDDLDLQVVWCEVIRRCGLPINRKDLSEGWIEHMRALPDEYGVIIHNLTTGLYPPLSGYYENKFYNGMGSAIRTEIWAALAPGDPDLAVRLSREDASCDHCLDGVEASAFLCAIESAAYVECDRYKLLKTGLSYLDPNGRLYKAFTATIEQYEKLHDPLLVRDYILRNFFSQNWTDVAINLSFIILSWLAGEGDVDKSICIAAGLGHDADCTCATLGAILGTIDPDCYSERWTKPLGDDLVLSSCIANMHEVSTIGEFCDQVADISCDVIKYYNSKTTYTDAVPSKKDCAEPWAKSPKFVELPRYYDCRESLVSIKPLTIKLLYPIKVALAPGETGVFTAKISNPTCTNVNVKLILQASDGWMVSPDKFDFRINDDTERSIMFKITAPKTNSRRIAKNNLDFKFEVDGIKFDTSCGLISTIDFLRVKTNYKKDECPNEKLFKDAQIVNAYSHSQPIPEDGEYLYAVDIRSARYISEAIFAIQGTRPLKVWLDNELILDHDGAEYVPAFHRSDYIYKNTLKGEWHRVIIQTGKKGRHGSNKDINRSPNASLVPVEGAMSTFELRKIYDKEALYDGENGELFFSIANRISTQWLSDLEWRLPRF